MPTASCHRFLYGESPSNAGKRIWVVSGAHLQDWYFHNQFHGCVSLRRALELWALEDGVNLTVTLTRDGTLDFSGNADPAAAEQMFSGAWQRRPPRYGNRPGSAQSGAQQNSQQNETSEAQAQQAAAGAQQAAGGAGQAFINTLNRLTQFLQSTTSATSGLVIIEDLPYIREGLRFDPNNAPVLREIENIIYNKWHHRIEARNMVVFFSREERDIEEVLPKKSSKKVTWKEPFKPSESEVAAALDRLAMRRNAVIVGGKSIARILVDQEDTLELALSKVLNLLNRGEREITAGRVLDMQPVNEQAILEVKAELNDMVGLEDLKLKVEAIEQKARDLRKNLLEGNSIPQEESMHLVFTGPPGTGKTTAARIVSKLFNALGLLKKSELKDIIASDILSSNREESGENMRRIINESRGGVLFIDEAHQLGDRDSMGANEAVKVLVPLSLNYRRELVIILAGYDDKMHELFNMDPGMPRRFPEHGRILFRDYSNDELWEIFTRELRKRGFSLDQAIATRTRNLLVKRSRRPSFGNAGGVGNLVNEILERHRSASKVISAEDLPPLVKRHPDTMQEAYAKLNAMFGIEPVKEQLRLMIESITYDLNEEEAGTGTGDIAIHPGNMRFVGPPGTGKTTVARLMAKLLYGIGCIEKPICIEMSPGSLRGRYQGWTGDLVRRRIDEARDGVFFIDEAYGLVRGEHDSYGQEAVDELVQQITRPENQGTVFIIAGYKNRIDQFLLANEGLARRFPQEVVFPNFAPEECARLARYHFEAKSFSWIEGVLSRIQLLAEGAAESMGDNFGNAGWVESLVGSTLTNLKSRAIRCRLPHGSPECRRVLLEDLPETASHETSESHGAEQAEVELAAWTPGQDYLHLPDSAPFDCTVPGEIVKSIHQTSFQIVTIETDGHGSATGFFVTPDGLMATCAHVIKGARTIAVLCGTNRTPLQACAVAYDDGLDLALLAVDGIAPLPFLRLGDSMPLAPLNELIVFGNAHVRPGDPGRVVTARVSRNDANNPRDFECDGSVEEGYSGGPVVSATTGMVVGIVSGGRGDYTKKMIRSEQLKYMLEELGYTFSDSNMLEEA